MVLSWSILAIGLACILPIYGQQKSTQSAKHPKTTQQPTQSATAPTVIYAINQNGPEQNSDGAEDHSKSYLERLLSPQNLPNILLVVAGFVGIIVAIFTLRSIKKQAGLMEKDIAVTHRAYLSVGPIEEPVDNQAMFPIKNTGHVPTLIVSVGVEVISYTPVKTEAGRWSSASAPFQDLNPGDIFELRVSLPKATVNNGDVVVIAAIDYSTGFKTSETPGDALRFTRVYSRERRAWVSASPFTEIEFAEAEGEDEQGRNPI